METHPAIAPLVERIRCLPSVERIVLFESRTRADHGARSDIDLGVSCPNASLEEWAMIWNIVDEAPTLLNIDLARLEHVDEAFRQKIERAGVVLYARR